MLAKDLRNIMAKMGFRTVNDMIGRVDCLQADDAIDHWKKRGLDFSNILKPAEKIFENTEVYNTIEQDHGLDKALDKVLIRKARDAIKNKKTNNYRIKNS